MRISIVSVIVTITIWSVLCDTLSSIHGKSTRPAAAVPKGKSSKSPFKGIFGNSLVRGIMRDAKMAFSSPLELITLQLTRPSNTAVPLSQLDELATFVELEGDNPEALVGGLAKLSRKFAEPNIFSQLKTIASLHYVLRHVGEKMSVEWARAILSMMKEKDEKTSALFFDITGLEITKSEVESALELEVAALTELYFDYFINLLKRKIPLTAKHVLDPKAIHSSVKQLMNLLTEGNEVYDMAKKMDGSALINQLTEFIELDFAWIGQQLAQFYEKHSFDKELHKHIEDILIELKVSFVSSSNGTDDCEIEEKESKKLSSIAATEKETKKLEESSCESLSTKPLNVLSCIRGDVEKSGDLSSPISSVTTIEEDTSSKYGNKQDNEDFAVDGKKLNENTNDVAGKNNHVNSTLNMSEEFRQSSPPFSPATRGTLVVKKVKKRKPKPRPSSMTTDDYRNSQENK